jgi:hypothetical protein
MMNAINLDWWNCFIYLYYESIGSIMGENLATILINVARNANVTKKEIDDIIAYYDGDLQEEVKNFLIRLKDFVE